MLAGLILAGGRSSRFGSDKSAALLRGQTFLQIAVLALQPSCRRLAVSARPGSIAAELAQGLDLPVLEDRDGDAAGPLSGVRQGLAFARDVGAPSLAVRPVDTPFIPDGTVERLLAAIGPAPAAYIVTDNGPEPLCAVWALGALPLVDAALSGERHPAVHRFLDAIGAVAVKALDAAAFANVNTLEELAAAEAAKPL